MKEFICIYKIKYDDLYNESEEIIISEQEVADEIMSQAIIDNDCIEEMSLLENFDIKFADVLALNKPIIENYLSNRMVTLDANYLNSISREVHEDTDDENNPRLWSTICHSCMERYGAYGDFQEDTIISQCKMNGCTNIAAGYIDFYEDEIVNLVL